MFCPKCGTQVEPGHSYCQKCGAAVGQPGATPQPQVYAAPPMSGQPVMAAVKTSGMAIASMVLGIVGFVLAGGLFSILAIIFGGIGMGQINRSRGALKGKGMAVAGLVLGIIGLILGIIIIILVGFSLTWVRDFSNDIHY